MATPRIQEYGWTDGNPTHAHGCLVPALEIAIRRLGPLATGPALAPRALDAGCGNGVVAAWLHRQGFRVAGFDASSQGIALARKAVPEAHFEVLCSGDPIGARLGTDWDLVVAMEVIEHLYAPRHFVAEIFDLLRPGGAFIITTPYHGYFKNLALALSGRLDRHFTALWDGGHIKFWSYRTLKQLLLETGFAAPSFLGAGRYPGFWKSMVVSVRKPD